MPINPSIALGVRSLEVPNPLNQLAQVSQIQASQRQGEVAQMQLEQLQQDRIEMQKLQQDLMAKGGNPDLRALATTLMKSPKHVTQGVELLQKLDEQDRYEATLKKIYGGGAAATAPAAAPMAPAQPGALGSGTFGVMPAPAAAPANALAPAAPAAAPSNALINQPNTADQLEARIAMLAPFASRPGVQAQISGLQTQLTELRKPVVASPGSTIYGAAGNVIANVPAQPTELQRNYEYAKKQGYGGSIFDYEREMKMAGRTPAQPAAPSITQIVDPTDPNKMITIDARRYQGGGAGSPGVIGVAGKEPSAALRTNKIEEGKTTLFNVIEDVKSHYQALKDAGDISSTEANPLANVISAGQSSALGQWAGRTFGTESQRARENIKSSRLILLNALKQATGKSAQELNSNVELKTNLEALSDPSQGYETAMDILNKLEDIYVRGVAPVKKAPAGTSAPPAAPAAAAPSSIRSQADAILRGGKP